jgi:5'-methylthioadenosine/S-adenosylhomocysteine nucleosidase
MLAVLYALEEEIRGLHPLLVDRTIVEHPWARVERGVCDGHQIVLVHSGAGKVLSTMTAQSVLDRFSPSCLALCGVSGALNPAYARGDLVIGNDFIQHDIKTEYFGFADGQVPFTDLRVIPSFQPLLETTQRFGLSDAAVHRGRILSGDQFVSGIRGSELRRDFGGDVVDMESAAVALVCHLNKTPFIVARTISDRANEEAASDFGDFLPRASIHVTAFIRHLLGTVFSSDFNERL